MSSSDSIQNCAIENSTQSDCKTGISANDQSAMDSPEPSHKTDKVERHVRFAITEDADDKPSKQKKLKKSRSSTATRHPSEYKPPKPYYVAWDVGVVALERLKQKIPNHKRIRVLQNVATKDLSEHTFAPYLGLDTTLPQHRPSTPRIIPPANQHRVYYFLYDEFAKRDTIAQIIKRKKLEKKDLLNARIEHGAEKVYEGDFVLVDSPGSEVQGKAILLRSRQEEDLLRAYMTANYEVVRCTLHMRCELGRAKTVGLTFRLKQEVWDREERKMKETQKRLKREQCLREGRRYVDSDESSSSSSDDDLPEWSIFNC